MKKILITDFLKAGLNDHNIKKIYLDLPAFDKNYKLKKNTIYQKRWNNYKLKLHDIKKNIILYNYFLNKLTIFLNKYHNKKFSKRFWSIILGQWLYRFISSISTKWHLIKYLKKDDYIFVKKKIDFKDTIPLGIEDYTNLANSNYWNHYIFTKIIEHSFSSKFKIIEKGKIIKNNEKNKIYEKLISKNIKDTISLFIQKALNFLPQKKNVLIFSTYLSNLQELKLNFLINKSLLYYKSLRPYLLFERKEMFNFKRKNYEKLASSNDGLKNFLGEQILKCIPSAYLENFKDIEYIVNKISFPKSPKKIFTTLGITRSTLMDRYIAKNVENGASLILAQHGGAYFQHKFHFSSIHEVKISDKYLSWGNIKKKNIIRLGIIKNVNNNFEKSNKIILEIRMRSTNYTSEIKIDSGFLKGKKYLENLCTFFSLLKKTNINKNLFIKLHEKGKKASWKEKEHFLSYNSKLKFIDEKKSMIQAMNSSKLIVHTFCGTGHLESIAVNKPTLIFFTLNFNLLNNRTRNYFKKFVRLGIVHTTPESLLKMLNNLDNEKNLKEWWNCHKRQHLLKKYRQEFCLFNQEKIKDLKKIIESV